MAVDFWFFRLFAHAYLRIY